MLDGLTAKLSNIISKIGGYGRLDEKNVDTALREVRLALLEADVHIHVVKAFLEKIKAKAMGTGISKSLNASEVFVRIVYDELTALLGKKIPVYEFRGNSPHVIFLVGLQGSGKTTTAGKLAGAYIKKGRHPYLVPADTSRPAAIDQLQILARRIAVPCYPTRETDKPVKVVGSAVSEAREAGCDLVLVDTAGRLQVDDRLMDELIQMKEKVNPAAIYFVADAMTGQDAYHVARVFHEKLGLTGVILTKMDGDAKGGAALSIATITGCPIVFIGVGEGMADLEEFYPDRMAGRLLDRGDLLTMVEKAGASMGEDEAKALAAKLKKKGFDLEDFLKQLRMIKKMGRLEGIIGMIPGMKGKMAGMNLDRAEGDLKKKEAIIQSMTPEERRNPKVLNGSRRSRIARGSGTEPADVNRLVREFAGMQEMMKKMKGGNLWPL